MKQKITRLMGYSRILFNIIWIALGISGIIYGLRGIKIVETAAINNLIVIEENIEIVKNLLVEAIDVIVKIDQSLSTIEQSSIDAGVGLIETRPVIDKTSQVVTEDLPKALDDMQTSMPSVIEAAAMIDQTLYILSKFRFTIPVPFGNDIEIGLGIDYTPSIPLEDALVQLNSNLEGIPDRMRSIEGDLVTTDLNLGIMSENMNDMAYDLDLIREQVADITPEFEKMINNLEILQKSLEKSKKRLPNTISSVRRIGILLLVLIILGQIPSAFIGFMLVKEGVNQNQKTMGVGGNHA
jgi:tRNA A-37 threonylcarbamoyl transferase component Bud32